MKERNNQRKQRVSAGMHYFLQKTDQKNRLSNGMKTKQKLDVFGDKSPVQYKTERGF